MIHRSSLAALVVLVPAFAAGCTADFDRFLGSGGGGTGGATTSTTTTTTTGGGGTGTGGGDVCTPACEDNNPCTDNVCTAGVCSFVAAVAPDLSALDDPTDCKNPICNGTVLGDENDDTEVPTDDANDCTDETCVGGAPHPFSATGTACNGDGVCNAAGVCSACNVAADCGTDNACVTWACGASCMPTYQPDQTKVSDDGTVGNCKATVCDGAGNLVVGNDNADFTANANPCLINSCNNGSPATNNAPSSTTCDDGGSNENSGRCTSGACVDCNTNGGCDAGHVCVSNACCTPESMATTCGTDECGSKVNNCGQMVNCGSCAADPDGTSCISGTCGCSNANMHCTTSTQGHDCVSGKCGCDGTGNDCMGVTGKPNCNTTAKVCVACFVDGDCNNNTNGEDCLPTFVCGCDADTPDCANVGTAHTCNTVAGVCNP